MYITITSSTSLSSFRFEFLRLSTLIMMREILALSGSIQITLNALALISDHHGLGLYNQWCLVEVIAKIVAKIVLRAT